jgi:protein gp37
VSENTKIEWADHSWSPWWGCVEVSPACDNCYARMLSKRYGHDVWGKDKERRELSDEHWKKPLAWNRQAEQAGVRYRVFPSMCDPFEYRLGDSLLDELRWRFWDLIEATPNLDWLLLTKRPQNVGRMIPGRWSVSLPFNAQIGATVEDKARLPRIESLRRVKANVRFLSLEPLLEDLGTLNLDGIHQVIVGGESGHNARPMHPDWARSLRDQCIAAGVAFHFKQWGEWAPWREEMRDTSHGRLPVLQSVDGCVDCGYYCDESVGHVDHRQVPMAKIGKKNAGRTLDGRTWDEMPGVTNA